MSFFNSAIKNFFYSKLNVDSVYLPYEWCPLLGMQFYEINQNIKQTTENPGYCLAWNISWIHKRTSHPEKHRDILLMEEIQKLKKKPYTFTSYIRSYSKQISDITIKLMVQSLIIGGRNKIDAKNTIDIFWQVSEPIIANLNRLNNATANTTNIQRNKIISEFVEATKKMNI